MKRRAKGKEGCRREGRFKRGDGKLCEEKKRMI
jgi:hypothetical protein